MAFPAKAQAPYLCLAALPSSCYLDSHISGTSAHRLSTQAHKPHCHRCPPKPPGGRSDRRKKAQALGPEVCDTAHTTHLRGLAAPQGKQDVFENKVICTDLLEVEKHRIHTPPCHGLRCRHQHLLAEVPLPENNNKMPWTDLAWLRPWWRADGLRGSLERYSFLSRADQGTHSSFIIKKSKVPFSTALSPR